MKTITLFLIKFYQIVFKGILRPFLFFETKCRYYPSCSVYTYQAVERYGTMKGLFLGWRRILSCHPFSKLTKGKPIL